MGATHVLPPPLAAASEAGHPVELWILVNGDIVQCSGLFLPADPKGRLQLTAALPEGFVGVMRTGAAVRGFFTDGDGSVHTFLTSVHDWLPYRDRPTAAQVLLEPPSLVAPCQRRRGDRLHGRDLVARLTITIRGEREVVRGRVVDVSPSGLAIRVVRNGRSWFAEGTRLEIEVDVPGRPDPLRFPATVARIGEETLHYRHGLRVDAGSSGRRALAELLDYLL